MNKNGKINFCFKEQKHTAEIEKIGKALSSPIRISIIRQLLNKPMTITELSALNGLPNSTTIFHLRILEKAKIVIMHYRPNKKGHTQVFFLNFLEIHLSLSNNFIPPNNTFTQSMPVGMFTDAEFYEYVRFATDTEIIRIDAKDCFNPLRMSAQLLWTNGGKITYSFGNNFATEKLSSLSFSLEICSETVYYNNDWKSDISFAVNNVELLTYTSPSDYGGEIRGKLNPAWWTNNNTQYGDLITISITERGVFLNNNIVNQHVTLSDLKIENFNKLLLSIYTKKDAVHYGGFNIFGKSFGNHPQDIVLTAVQKDNLD